MLEGSTQTYHKHAYQSGIWSRHEQRKHNFSKLFNSKVFKITSALSVPFACMYAIGINQPSRPMQRLTLGWIGNEYQKRGGGSAFLTGMVTVGSGRASQTVLYRPVAKWPFDREIGTSPRLYTLPVFTVREHGSHFGQPCSKQYNTILKLLDTRRKFINHNQNFIPYFDVRSHGEIFIRRSWYSVVPSLDATISCRIKKAVVGVTQLITALVSIHSSMTFLDIPTK